jgi:PPM family protein phosphatase
MTSAPQPGVGVMTDAGRRRDHNEDAYLVRPPVYVIADGMGGHAAGEVASKLAVDSIAQASLDGEGGRAAVLRALEQANRVVFQAASDSGPQHGMGTTCAVLVVGDDVVHVGNVGDSRIYRLREGSLEQLTRDHTVVAEMVDHGLIKPDDALFADNRSSLTRALGGAADVDAEVETIERRAGDRFLLCSDGLSSMVDDAVIQGIVVSSSDPQVAAQALVDAANAAGGDDNVTTIVVDPDAIASLPASSGRRTSNARAILFLIVLLVVVIVVAAVVLRGATADIL